MKKAILLFFLLSLNAIAHAGVISGGGGKSVVCRNSDLTIKSAEILDLYEGRVQYGLSYIESPLPWQFQAEEYLTRPSMNLYLMWYRNIIEHIRFLPDGTGLEPIDDSLEVITPKDCHIEQTVNYLNDQLILVNSEIWNSLSETQRAALLIHESVYRLLREHNETDSRRSRHFTAYLFSEGRVEEPHPGFDLYGLCQTADKNQPTTFFYILPPFIGESGRQQVRLQFLSIGGNSLLTKTFADFDNGPPPNPPESTISSFLDELRFPDEVDRSSYKFKTTSLFEGGKHLELNIGKHAGTSSISISGRSLVDDKPFNVDLNCFFRTQRIKVTGFITDIDASNLIVRAIVFKKPPSITSAPVDVDGSFSIDIDSGQVSLFLVNADGEERGTFIFRRPNGIVTTSVFLKSDLVMPPATIDAKGNIVVDVNENTNLSE